MDIGHQIKHYREQVMLSQRELAEKIFVSERSIGHYETGTRVPPIDKVLLIADILDVELQDLIEQTTKESKDWYIFMSEPPKNVQKKFMDEARFHLFLKRTELYCNVKDTAEYIKSDSVFYPKRLGSFLSSMVSEQLTFTIVFSSDDSLRQWMIIGYFKDVRFAFDIKEKEEHVEFHTKGIAPLHTEFNKVVRMLSKWFECYYVTKKILYDMESLLSLNTISKTELLAMTLYEFHFPNEFNYFVLFQRMKRDGVDSLEKLLNAKEFDYILDFHAVETDFINKVKQWLDEQK